MSGPTSNYQPQIDLARGSARPAPGPSAKRRVLRQHGAERWKPPEAGPIPHRPDAGRGVLRAVPRPDVRGDVAVRVEARHRRGFSPLVPDIHHIPFRAAASRGRADGRHLSGGARPGGADAARRAADEVAAIFMEPIQGEAATTSPPVLPAGLASILRQARYLYWCSTSPVRHGADGNRVRLRAVGDRAGPSFAWRRELPRHAARRKSWPGQRHGLAQGSHASTFGGNPVSCRAALATLELAGRGYLANATARGGSYTTA